MHSLLFAIEASLPLGLNSAALWRLLRPAKPCAIAPWRRLFAYLALAANFLAYVIPWAGFVYMYILLKPGRPVYASEMINGMLVLNVSICIAALSFVLGALSFGRVRILLMLSAVCIAYFWLSIPRGIL